MAEFDELDGWLDAYVAELDAWGASVVRRFLCIECGRRVNLRPPRPTEDAPGCCGWEMVELPPAGVTR